MRSLFLDTLAELSLEAVMRERVRCEDGVLEVGGERVELEAYKKVLVAAVGKAAGPMARAFVRAVEPKRVSGVIVSSTETADPPPYFLTYVGSHPYPDAGSVHAAEVALGMVS
ncbi:MAG: DUF4147 domain-containing protein, partial [Acidobacteria bacterium]|nr:DUF4147 domain-containing protein [Acidobacteriota bacterium]